MCCLLACQPTAGTLLQLFGLCPPPENSTQMAALPCCQLCSPGALSQEYNLYLSDTLGGVHKRNFTWCLDFKHCETPFHSSQIKVKANKYFTYEAHTVYRDFGRCRTERKLHAVKMSHEKNFKGFSSHSPVKSRLTPQALPRLLLS